MPATASTPIDRRQRAHPESTGSEATAPIQVRDRLERVVQSTSVRSGYVSLLGHIFLAMLLAFLAVRPPEADRLRPLVLGFSGDAEPIEAAFQLAARETTPAGNDDATSSEDQAEAPAPEETAESTDAAAEATPDADDQLPHDAPEQPALEPPSGLLAQQPTDESGSSAQPATDEHAATTSNAASGPLLTAVSSSSVGGRPGRVRQPRTGGGGGVTGVPFANRSGDAKRASLRTHGGSAASELAVSRGLDWLASHQGPDGSWRCDLANSRCRGACRNPGSITGSVGPTALALLPFLGAGSTHLDGPHQATVSRGLYYLATNIRPTPRGGDLCEGSMYAHGIAVLAMAEAYGMTKDEFLEPLLKEAVRFTETSQDLHGGGWRYLPGQAGDTTVTGWQVVSLKSAAMAGVPVRSPTLDGVQRFLDSVQTQGGAAYGYRTPAAKPSTSAVGLLARMYTGWDVAVEPLQRGMTRLAARGPDPNAIYENFYLAQVLMQADHPVWPRWNASNRDQIIRQQAVHGHESGSWFFADPDSAPGGRLAHTALAILTLEVYYRLLPIYGEAAVDGAY